MLLFCKLEKSEHDKLSKPYNFVDLYHYLRYLLSLSELRIKRRNPLLQEGGRAVRIYEFNSEAETKRASHYIKISK